VLVVLGILVVLFALLFVPMTSSLNMITSGRTQAEMQQRLRLAMEQVQRDLAEAIYVYPPELIRIAGAGTAYSGDDVFLVNYSVLSLVLPAKEAGGQAKQPLQPVFQSVPGGGQLPVVTRYAVHTKDTAIRRWPAGSPGNPGPRDKYFMVSAGPGPESTFQLYRQQGFCIYDADLGTYTFGSYTDLNGDGTVAPTEFVIDRPNAENALTPRSGADVVCTGTICRDNGKVEKGWVEVNLNDVANPSDDTLDTPPDPTWTPQVVYQFDNVQFRPERVVDETMQPSPDWGTYRASRGSWLGLLNDGSISLFDIVWGVNPQWINCPELNPRIVVRRWDAGAGAYANVVLDTDALDPSQPPPSADVNNLLTLRWNSQAGTVLVADSVPTLDQAPNDPGVMFQTSSDPGLSMWPLTSRPDLLPEYPPSPQAVTDPRVPVGYVLDPWQAEGVAAAWSPWRHQAKATDRDIKVLPGTIRIWLVWQEQGSSEVARREFSASNTLNPQDLGLFQFSATPFDDDRQVEIRFNPYLPPGPDLVAYLIAPRATTLVQCKIQVYYQARRNFDPVSGKDDQITVTYSTATLYSVRLGLSEYSPYETITAGSAVKQPFKSGAQLVMTAQLAVQNLGR